MEKLAKVEEKEAVQATDGVLEGIPKDEQQQPTEDHKDHTEPKSQSCPHCGLDLDKPRIEVSEDDRQQWIRHILSGGKRRFTKDYEIYGGRISFRLRSRNGLEDRDVDLATNYFIQSINDISDFNKIRVEMMKIQLLYSLEHIFYVDMENPENTRRVPIQAPTKEEIEEAWALGKSAAIKKYINFLEDIDPSIMSLLCDKLAEFNSTVSMLTIEGLNPDF